MTRRLLEDGAEDRVPGRDRVLDRDHLSANLRMLTQPTLRGVLGDEEVEDWAAAAARVALPVEHAGHDDRRARLPGRPTVGGDLRLKRLPGDGVVGADLDRLREHRRDPERVDRAHRMHLVPAREANAVRSLAPREGIGDGDLTIGAAMDEILAREGREPSSASAPSRAASSRISVLLGRPRVANRRRIQK